MERAFYSIAEVASMIGLSKERVRQLTRAGLLKARFRLLGGHNYQTLIDGSSFTHFIDDFFPKAEDLDPDSPNPRIRRLRKVVERQKAISRKGGLTTAMRRKPHTSNAIGQTYSMESEGDLQAEKEQIRPESLREPERALGDDRQPLSREENEKDEDD